MIRNIFLLMLSALCAWSCTDNLPGDEAPTDGRHSLNITVGPKPAFTDGTLTRADGTTLPETRAVQTDEGTKWEGGDLVWLYVEFTDDSNKTTVHYSALKYTGTTWRYLTGDEANSLELNPNLNGVTFNRTLIYSQADGSTQYVMAGIRAYVGNSKPDTNGLITIPAPDSGSSVPVMEAGSRVADLSQPLTLNFTYRCSRLRIPAGYSVQMKNYRYYASCNLAGGILNIKTDAIPRPPCRRRPQRHLPPPGCGCPGHPRHHHPHPERRRHVDFHAPTRYRHRRCLRLLRTVLHPSRPRKR